jgi:hypothetical protein
MFRFAAVCLLLLTTGGCDILFDIDVLVRDSRRVPIPDARVSVRYARNGDERASCSTDPAGRCEASTVTGSGRFVVMITKTGYQQAVLELSSSSPGWMISLEPRRSAITELVESAV